MSLINTTIKPFKATAYHNGNFVSVSDEDLKGKWAVVVFYPADFTFVCPTELGDLADNYAEFKKWRGIVRSIDRYTLHPQSMG
jgi:peroxiredoxin (alkyl hydroperoxide reductase subunit C)